MTDIERTIARTFVAVAAMSLLGGCVNEQTAKVVMARCEAIAAGRAPSDSQGAAAPSVRECMEAKGFRWKKRCDPEESALENLYCYDPPLLPPPH